MIYSSDTVTITVSWVLSECRPDLLRRVVWTRFTTVTPCPSFLPLLFFPFHFFSNINLPSQHTKTHRWKRNARWNMWTVARAHRGSELQPNAKDHRIANHLPICPQGKKSDDSCKHAKSTHQTAPAGGSWCSYFNIDVSLRPADETESRILDHANICCESTQILLILERVSRARLGTWICIRLIRLSFVHPLVELLSE